MQVTKVFFVIPIIILSLLGTVLLGRFLNARPAFVSSFIAAKRIAPELKTNVSSRVLSTLGSRPMTRAVVMYVPAERGKPSEMIREAFGLIESWKTVFTQAEQEAIRFPDDEEYLNGIELDDTLQFPWLQKQRERVYSATLKGMPDLRSMEDYRLREPDGPPLITDLILITHPDNDVEANFHPSCQVLEDMNFEVAYSKNPDVVPSLNLTERLQDAQNEVAAFIEAFNASGRSYENKRKEAVIGNSRCFYLKAFNPSTAIKALAIHPAIYSIGCLVGELAMSVLEQYDIIMRSDADCFITPFFNDPRLVPWKLLTSNFMEPEDSSLRPFILGKGGYSGPPQNTILKNYASLFGLRHQGLHSLGSTWYGSTLEILKAAQLSVAVAEALLKNDGVFIHTKGGVWPKWYRGVTSMYSNELAVNHLIDKARLFVAGGVLDGLNMSNKTWTTNAAHIHLWHTDDFFSKFKRYNVEVVKQEDADILKLSWYCCLHTMAGNLIYQRGLEKQPKETIYDSLIVDENVPLQTEYFGCPPDFPYAYQQGYFCCAVQEDCNDHALDISSSCCKDNNYKSCPSAHGCQESVASRNPLIVERKREVVKKKFLKYMTDFHLW